MAHLVHVFAITLTAVAIISQIVSIATPNYMSDVSTDSVYEKIGLFYWCDGRDCQKVPSETFPSWAETVQVLAIVALIGLVFALVTGIASICSHSNYYILNIVAAVIVFLAAFFIMVEFSFFVAEKKTDPLLMRDNFRLGYSFFFSITAFLLSLAGGVFFILTLFCTPEY
ncbi:uncharacterized protein [Littorina saxatilis]|uniref:Uncharacterized protein n=1 Tax=Littorina saxatilis TaxID=31220 RepID=A0AAN9AMQ1_9CAEN